MIDTLLGSLCNLSEHVAQVFLQGSIKAVRCMQPFIHNLKHEYGVTVAVLVSDSVSQWHCNGHNWCHRPFTLFTMFGKVVLPCKVECKGRNLALAELGVRRIDVAVATLVLCSEAAFGWE